MEVSKFTNTAEYYPSTSIKILEFLQEDARNGYKFTRDTSAKQLGELLAHRLQILPRSTQVAINALIRKGLINRYKTEGHRADFKVNYFSPLLPPNFIDGASEEEKEYVKKVYKMAEERRANGTNAYVDGEGCVVSKNTQEPEDAKQDEPKQDEPKQEEPKQDEPKQDEPKQDEPKQEEEPVLDEPEPEKESEEEPSDAMTLETIKEIMMPVIMKRENSGRNISLTININLNA